MAGALQTIGTNSYRINSAGDLLNLEKIGGSIGGAFTGTASGAATGAKIGSGLTTGLQTANLGLEGYDFIMNPSTLNAGDVVAAGLMFSPTWPIGLAWSFGRFLGGLFGGDPKVKYQAGSTAQFAGQNSYDPEHNVVYFKIRSDKKDDTYAYDLNTKTYYKVGDLSIFNNLKETGQLPAYTPEQWEAFAPEDVINRLTSINSKDKRVLIFNPRSFQTDLFNEVIKNTEAGQEYLNTHTVQYGNLRYDPDNKTFFTQNGDMFAYIGEDNNIYTLNSSDYDKEKIGHNPGEEDIKKLFRGEFIGEVRNGVPYANIEQLGLKNSLQNIGVNPSTWTGEVPLSALNFEYKADNIRDRSKQRNFTDQYEIGLDPEFSTNNNLNYLYTEGNKFTSFELDKNTFSPEKQTYYWGLLPDNLNSNISNDTNNITNNTINTSNAGINTSDDSINTSDDIDGSQSSIEQPAITNILPASGQVVQQSNQLSIRPSMQNFWNWYNQTKINNQIHPSNISQLYNEPLKNIYNNNLNNYRLGYRLRVNY